MSDRKRINELRVIDLRVELEKRNLDKSGVRGVLLQRLTKFLEEEGHDVETYTFDLSESKASTKKTRRSGSTVEQECDDTPTIDDMIVQDDIGDDDEHEAHANSLSQDSNENTSSNQMEVETTLKNNRKREANNDTEASGPKKACMANNLEAEDNKNAENHLDTDDSINLDIGDDELLNEETENHTKSKEEKDKATETSSAAASGEDSAAVDPDSAAHDSSAADPQQDQVKEADPAANSQDVDMATAEEKDEKEIEGEGDKKDKKEEGKESGARNLWVSGLSGDTRAKDLKHLCTKYGKVIGAKVVTNARTPGSRCYGYVTMASSQDAENCIKNLHRTELHGRMISVEKAKSESESSSRRHTSRSDRHSSKEKKTDKENEKIKNKDGGDANKKDETSGENRRSTSHTREKSSRSDKDRARRSSKSRDRRKSSREVLSASQIWKERAVARARENARVAREEERRRRAAEEALRERERRQRHEKMQLQLEREKLRAEREKIEREKNELLRLERERHRLEREKLELERLELKRAQLRLEEERRKRTYDSGSYRKPASPPPRAPLPDSAYDRDRHKRVPPPSMSSGRGQFEAPPPPRFEVGGGYERADKRDRDYKRDFPRHASSSNLKYPSNGSASDDPRQPIAPGTRPKEPSRAYDSRGGYRSPPPSKAEPRSWSSSTRYPESVTKSSGGGGGGEQWSGSGESRYPSGYEPRYGAAYQPPPPGVNYGDRFAAQPSRDYRKY